ncbi:MAG TPA: TlpA disulfide reductase family protein [Candidatus Acidoferrales bacterium]|nr:TlpA disulfide reductase family protein [Candidatus Acidoferrales bacterium]
MNDTTDDRKPVGRSRRRSILLIVCVVIAVVAAAVYFSRDVVPVASTTAVGNSTLKVGEKAPEFTVETDDGPFDLDAVSTPVLLEIFATWCPHCQFETHVLNDVARKYQGKLAIVAVSGSALGGDHESPESQADVNAFAQYFHVSYPIAFDPDLSVAQTYLATGFPTMLLIKPDKTIAWINSGQLPEPSLLDAINQVVQ